ncbi:hypothetical protein G5B31_10605, partial [Rhodobacter sp. SGA-6-6]|uniref:hypothetical protein n=1 Tax=Rhodobacter sp. SGA-6-6 TaxID=2710882 RepID=UPI0013FC9F7F
HLARLQRNRGQTQSALLFAGEGLKRPRPGVERLFVWQDIYAFWLDFEYLHCLKDLGRMAEGAAALARMRAAGAPGHLYAVLGLA